MDEFTIAVIVMFALLIGGLLALGKWYPGTGADVLDWKPTRSPEVEVQNEIDDLDQMLEATNEKRRRRGEAEITEASLRDQVAADLREQNERRGAYLGDEDLHQMLEAKNERLRRRDESDLTEAELRDDVQGEARARPEPPRA